MLGRFTDFNLFLDATVTGPAGGWAAGYPLANMLKEADYVGSPARCVAAHDIALSWFELTLPQPKTLNLASLFFHSLSLSAKLRIRGGELADTTFAAPSVDTGWLWVYPSLYDPLELEVWQENFFTGTVTEAEARLLKRHSYTTLPTPLVQRLRFEIDDQLNPAGWFDIGGLHGALGLSPEINFDRGRELSVRVRDLVVTAPSGRRFAERRDPQRVLSASWSNLKDAEARRFVDSVLRAGSTGTVLFVPDLDDVSGAMREAFPATFDPGRTPSARFTYQGQAATAFTLEEILA